MLVLRTDPVLKSVRRQASYILRSSREKHATQPKVGAFRRASWQNLEEAGGMAT